MRFRLVYEGKVPTNPKSRIAAVHKIRHCLHQQMKVVWDLPPLVGGGREWFDLDSKACILERRGDAKFAPLVSDKNHLFAELDVLFIRPTPPNVPLSVKGDLDNRLKTLMDALRVPTTSEWAQGGLRAPESEDYVFCLLSDDQLVSRVNVEADRMLGDAGEERAICIINVDVKAAMTTLDNIGVGS